MIECDLIEDREFMNGGIRQKAIVIRIQLDTIEHVKIRIVRVVIKVEENEYILGSYFICIRHYVVCLIYNLININSL